MPKIQQLSPHVADLIAAGEVVERPASAAKELVENAIDAGAHKVTVELRDGGMTFLRVTDDGCGMAAEDVETAFLRHATSKLHEAADLEAIHTLGFRGEALAAISSVSRIDVLTKTADAPFGTSLHLEAGVVTERGEAGCPNGTTMLVRDLFYNTPARMKFMKRDSVEASAVLSTVQRLALAHPEVAVRVLRDGQEQLSTPGDGKLLSAIYAVMGRQGQALRHGLCDPPGRNARHAGQPDLFCQRAACPLQAHDGRARAGLPQSAPAGSFPGLRAASAPAGASCGRQCAPREDGGALPARAGGVRLRALRRARRTGAGLWPRADEAEAAERRKFCLPHHVGGGIPRRRD